jgi:hypothetical protein
MPTHGASHARVHPRSALSRTSHGTSPHTHTSLLPPSLTSIHPRRKQSAPAQPKRKSFAAPAHQEKSSLPVFSLTCTTISSHTLQSPQSSPPLCRRLSGAKDFLLGERGAHFPPRSAWQRWGKAPTLIPWLAESDGGGSGKRARKPPWRQGGRSSSSFARRTADSFDLGTSTTTSSSQQQAVPCPRLFFSGCCFLLWAPAPCPPSHAKNHPSSPSPACPRRLPLRRPLLGPVPCSAFEWRRGVAAERSESVR